MEPDTKAHQLLGHIGNELKLLWCQMDAYQELFLVEPEKRQPLLQSTAPGFFAIVQVSFSESILIRIFRLMDPTKSCGDENASIKHLHDELKKDDTAQVALRTCIALIHEDWKIVEKSPYALLKIARNKFLAHNDLAKRSAMDGEQLWMNISQDEFKSAQSLAGRLWAMYRQCHQVLLGADIVEPMHEKLENRPSMLLKHLCASRYLESVVMNESDHVLKLQATEATEMGNDDIRPVFVNMESAMKCGAIGDPQ